MVAGTLRTLGNARLPGLRGGAEALALLTDEEREPLHELRGQDLPEARHATLGVAGADGEDQRLGAVAVLQLCIDEGRPQLSALESISVAGGAVLGVCQPRRLSSLPVRDPPGRAPDAEHQ